MQMSMLRKLFLGFLEIVKILCDIFFEKVLGIFICVEILLKFFRIIGGSLRFLNMRFRILPEVLLTKILGYNF